jgi:peptidyl-dipeptidase A
VSDATGQVSPSRLVEDIVRDLAPLDREVSEAWWHSNIASSVEAEQRRVALEQRWSDRLAEPTDFAALDAAGPLDDPQLARSVDVLRLMFATEQTPAALREEMVRLSARCDTTYATFRGESGGRRWTDNDVERVLVESDDDDERRAAWEASKQVGVAVRDDVLRLVELRNEAAVALGHRDFYAMSLSLGEISETRLFGLLDELEVATRDPFATLKAGTDAGLAARFGVEVGDLAPWHLADPFFQEVPREMVPALDLDPLLGDCDATALTLATYDSLGMDLRPVLERSDLITRDGKNQHAFCICIDRARDVRVLANVVPGERWTSTMLHEFGHAAYDVGISMELPWALRKPAHSLTTEAVAQLFGRLSKNAGWLRDIADIPPARLAGVETAVDAVLRAHMLVFARWVLVMCHFERGLYADPAADHNTRWWELVERYQLVRRPAGRDGCADWAAKLHLALAPVYYQNYVLGECLASQLEASIRSRGGALYGDEATGEWLRRSVFAPGASMRWDHLVEQATGEPLSARHFVDQFVAPASRAG